MEEVRCIKCGRPLRDPASIARGMGPECAGVNDGRRSKYRGRVRSHRSPYDTAPGREVVVTPAPFNLVEEGQRLEEKPLGEVILSQSSASLDMLMQFPAELTRLVLSAPTTGAIARHLKKYSAKKTSGGSLPPVRILQEIRRLCIELRLTFWPGLTNHQGQPIACLPYGEEGWKFENSEKVMSRQELEAYLSRYGLIRSAGRGYQDATS